MSNKKISDLPVAGALSGTHEFEINQAGSGKRVTLTSIFSFIVAAMAGTDNRITLSLGGVIDIAATYIGQSSITTLGTITSGTWNSKFKPRVDVAPTGASLTPNVGLFDQLSVTALDTNTTINNPTGTPEDGQRLVIRIRDDGTPRTIAFDTLYRGFGAALVGTTTANKTLYITAIYNDTETKWDVVNTVEQV